MTSLKNSGIVPSKTIGYNINTIYNDIKTTTSNSLLTCKVCILIKLVNWW